MIKPYFSERIEPEPSEHESPVFKVSHRTPSRPGSIARTIAMHHA